MVRAAGGPRCLNALLHAGPSRACRSLGFVEQLTAAPCTGAGGGLLRLTGERLCAACVGTCQRRSNSNSRRRQSSSPRQAGAPREPPALEVEAYGNDVLSPRSPRSPLSSPRTTRWSSGAGGTRAKRVVGRRVVGRGAWVAGTLVESKEEDEDDEEDEEDEEDDEEEEEEDEDEYEADRSAFAAFMQAGDSAGGGLEAEEEEGGRPSMVDESVIDDQDMQPSAFNAFAAASRAEGAESSDSDDGDIDDSDDDDDDDDDIDGEIGGHVLSVGKQQPRQQRSPRRASQPKPQWRAGTAQPLGGAGPSSTSSRGGSRAGGRRKEAHRSKPRRSKPDWEAVTVPRPAGSLPSCRGFLHVSGSDPCSRISCWISGGTAVREVTPPRCPRR